MNDGYRSPNVALLTAITNLHAEVESLQAEVVRLQGERDEAIRLLRAFTEKCGGDGWDGTLGWHQDHPLLQQARIFLAKKEADHE